MAEVQKEDNAPPSMRTFPETEYPSSHYGENNFAPDGRGYDVARGVDMYPRDPYSVMRRVPYERVKNGQFFSSPYPNYFR
jgi:hypothetical protein